MKGKGAAAMLLLVVWGCAPATVSTPVPSTGQTGPATPEPDRGGGREVGSEATPDDPAVARFTELLNTRRIAAGCPPLAWDARVAAVAAAHSRDMVERGYFSHTSPTGDDPFRRLEAAGIAFVAAAENIAHGSETGEGVFRQWEESPGHRANMMSCRYTLQGVGRFGTYWTQLLMTPPG